MTDELRNAIKEKSIVIGNKQTIKNLKTKSVKSVFIASNCPQNMKKDIEYYSKISGIKCEAFEGTAKQLGVLCGKPFSIAVLAIK
ncbi:MAG: 50S ribosomal protein L30e [Candidatus Aenigmatarchaeota archaeon]